MPGLFEILIVLLVLSLIVGPRRLIGLGQAIGEALGRGTRDFMGKIDGDDSEKEISDDTGNGSKQLTRDKKDGEKKG